MLFRPGKVWEMWDTWLFHERGVHYLYYLHKSTRDSWDGMSVATSRDGVHFEEIGPIIAKRNDAEWLGTGSVWKAGGAYRLNFSESRSGVQAVFFARSDDLLHWERLGDEYRSDPDPRWYDDTRTGRWDCIWTVPRPGGGYWGYLTARPWSKGQGAAYESLGRVESDDGVSWRAAPPPRIDWGDWPAMNLGEVGAIERIGSRYYLMVGMSEGGFGGRQVSASLPTPGGMYTFVADDPAGPFRPDTVRYRLLVSNSTYFARFYPTPDGMLVNHHSFEVFGDGPRVWLAPLKRTVVDTGGHLSLGYWEGNERLKGREVPLDLTRSHLLYPADGSITRGAPGRLQIDEPARGGLVVLDERFDVEAGVVLEAALSVREPPRRWSGIGAFIEHGGEGKGTTLMCQTRGITEISSVDATGGLSVRERVDVGIGSGPAHRIRLLLRRSMLELYLDDGLVQCHSLPEMPTGRIGFAFESGTAVFQDVRAWGMAAGGNHGVAS